MKNIPTVDGLSLSDKLAVADVGHVATPLSWLDPPPPPPPRVLFPTETTDLLQRLLGIYRTKSKKLNPLLNAE